MKISNKKIMEGRTLMNLLHAFRFGIKLNHQTLSFQEISGLSKEIEVETYQEGGRNDSVLLFPKKTTNAGSLTCKKGVYKGRNHPFYLVGEHIDNLSIEVYDYDGLTVVKSYMVKDIIVCKWEVSSFHAQNNELLIDTFTLSYGEFYVVS